MGDTQSIGAYEHRDMPQMDSRPEIDTTRDRHDQRDEILIPIETHDHKDEKTYTQSHHKDQSDSPR